MPRQQRQPKPLKELLIPLERNFTRTKKMWKEIKREFPEYKETEYYMNELSEWKRYVEERETIKLMNNSVKGYFC
jgi:hypothetical protein